MNATVRKTTTFKLRIVPASEQALHRAAQRGHCSIANLIGIMACDHYERAGLVVPDRDQCLGDDHG